MRRVFEMSAQGRSTNTDVMLRRVYSEFLEMPGLRVTCEQAQRLWGLDEGTCAALLESLVRTKFLCRTRHGMYARLTDGNDNRPKMMAKARIGATQPHTVSTDAFACSFCGFTAGVRLSPRAGGDGDVRCLFCGQRSQLSSSRSAPAD